MRKTNIGWLVLIVAAAGFAAYSQSSRHPELTTVPSVDLKRYAGKWYEIARYPNKFQRDCVGNTAAEYSLKDNGKIEVINTCTKKDGSTKTAKGEAKVVDKAANSKLEVRFAPSFLSFLPSVWGDYWIIELGENYEYSVVGDPKREYFWILSREPEMNDDLYQGILQRAEEKGFQPGKVQKTAQKVDSAES